MYQSKLVDSLDHIPVDSITQFENDLLYRYWAEEDSLKAVLIRDSIDRFVRKIPEKELSNECLDLFLETDASLLDTASLSVMNWPSSPPGKLFYKKHDHFHINPRLIAFKMINDTAYVEYEIVYYYMKVVNSNKRFIFSNQGKQYTTEMIAKIAEDDFQSAIVTLVYLVDEKNRLFKIKRNFKL